MFKQREINKLPLSRYLEIEVLNNFHTYYNEILKPKYSIEILDFEKLFQEVISKSLWFYDNYETMGIHLNTVITTDIERDLKSINAAQCYKWLLINHLSTLLVEEIRTQQNGTKDVLYNDYLFMGGVFTFPKIIFETTQKFLNSRSLIHDDNNFDMFLDEFYKNVDGNKAYNGHNAYDLKQLHQSLDKITSSQPNDLIYNVSLNDFSDSKPIEKIRMLIELGFIKQLESMQITKSRNKVAEILSLITGEETTTIQPYINAYLTDSKLDKNPTHNQKAMSKTTLKAKELGFNTTHSQ